LVPSAGEKGSSPQAPEVGDDPARASPAADPLVHLPTAVSDDVRGPYRHLHLPVLKNVDFFYVSMLQCRPPYCRLSNYRPSNCRIHEKRHIADSRIKNFHMPDFMFITQRRNCTYLWYTGARFLKN
jgi:hypothetical protein